MQLTRLFLQGYRSYLEPTEVVLDGLRAVVRGHNGAGKSSLIEAVEYALKGTSRSSTVTGVVALGATEAVVELDFLHGGTYWRIRRTRSRTAGGTVNLYEYDATADTWEPYENAGSLGTQKTIDELLGLTSDALFVSALLKQGESARFTRAKPTDRRRVLREVMDLEWWQEAAKEAGRRLREAQTEAARIDTEIADLGDVDTLVESAGAEAEAADAALAGARKRVAAGEKAVQELGEQLTAAREALAEARGRASSRASAIRAAEEAAREVERLAGEVRGALTALEEAQAAETTAAGLGEARAALQDLQAKVEAQRVVDAERTRLTAEREVLVADRQAAAQRIANAEREHAGWSAALRAHGWDAAPDVPTLEREAQIAQEAARIAQRAEREQVERIAETRGLRDELQRLASTSSLIGEVPCGGHARWVAEGQVDDGLDLRSTCPLLTDARAAVGREANARARLVELEGVPSIDPRDVQEKRERASEAEGRVRAAKSLPPRPDPAALEGARADLAEIDVKGKALRAKIDALAEHDTTLMDRCLEAERRVRAVEAADADAKRLRAEADRLPDLESRHAAAQARAEELRADAAALDVDLSPLEREVESCEERRRAEEDRLRAARADVDVAQQRVTRAATAAQEAKAARIAKDKHAGARAAAGVKITKWSATREVAALAPTLVLESVAIPVLEAEANRVLGLISSTGMHVRLLTQRAKASGDGQIETLDIHVRDETGDRPYEDYSGGEQFRLDVAFALAQSVLVGSRARAPLDWLIIDEGWGCLDPDGIAALRDVVTALQSRYSTLLVVTHVPEVAECLPSQLTVTRGARGSEVTIR